MYPYRTCDFSPRTRDKIVEALCSILEGNCKRVEINQDVKVYECKNVVRIDLKIHEDV